MVLEKRPISSNSKAHLSKILHLKLKKSFDKSTKPRRHIKRIKKQKKKEPNN
jgi:hypothetical protein